MKIVLFGTSDCVMPTFEALVKGSDTLACFVTSVDKKSGRGMHLKVSNLKSFALANKIPIFQPENINSNESLKYLKELNADIFVVYAFGKILRPELLLLPPKGAINIHASLLPKYRGAAPINWAIYNAEKETGISIIQMNEFMDRGDIIIQDKVQIGDNDDAVSLDKKISQKAPLVLKKALELIKNNNVHFRVQNEKEATYAPILEKKHGRIQWEKSAEEIKNHLKAFVHWPGSYTFFNKMLVKILEIKIVDASFCGNPGEVVESGKKGILVATGKGLISLVKLQPEAKKVMSAQDFINGHKILPGSILGK